MENHPRQYLAPKLANVIENNNQIKMKAYQIVNENGIDGRTLGDIDQPAPKHNKILEGVDHSVEIGSAYTLEKPAMATRQAASV